MPINDFQPFEDSELLSAGMKCIAEFQSGHVHGAIYVPPDYDPNGGPEQYKTLIGCDPQIDFNAMPPPSHSKHIERALAMIHDKLRKIGDL